MAVNRRARRRERCGTDDVPSPRRYDKTMSSEFIESNLSGNRIQSVILVLAMVGILALVGFMFGQWTGVAMAISLCVAAILFGPAVSPRLLLRMYRAQVLPRDAAPHLYRVYDELASRADLPKQPELYYIPSRTLNAFAVGNRSFQAVAVTDGLLRMMDTREIAGVLAHELSHIRHKDMRVMGIADTVSRVIATLSQIGQLLLFLAIPMLLMNGSVAILITAILLIAAPIASNLLQLALSRSREFNADLGAVTLTGDATGLASALQKLERIAAGMGSPWLFPGRKRSETVPAVLRTHPPTDERVRRILEAGRSLGARLPDEPSVRPLGPRSFQPRVHGGPRWHAAGLWY